MIYDTIAGTDTAMVGVWDSVWSDPSIRERSIRKFVARLPKGAQDQRLFYVETGSDGEYSIRLAIDEPVSTQGYKLLANNKGVRFDSGTIIVDGLEFYGSPYTGKNQYAVPKGQFTVSLFRLCNREREESKAELVGESPTRGALYVPSAIAGLGLLIVAITLFFRKAYWHAAMATTLAAICSQYIGWLDARRKRRDKRTVKYLVKVPAYILLLQRSVGTAPEGGFAKDFE